MKLFTAGLTAVLCVACELVSVDLDRVISLEIVGPVTRTVEVGDTLQLSGVALNGRGEVVPEAVIVWRRIDVDSGATTLTLDSSTGLVTALAPNTARVQARVEELQSETITITIEAAPDSVGPTGPTRIIVDSAAIESEPLRVAVYDVTSQPGQATALAGKTVEYRVIDPDPQTGAADSIFLTEADSAPGAMPHVWLAITDTGGEAAVRIRKVTGATAPDSVTVHATALTATGMIVTPSPIPFVIVFN